MGRRPPRMVCYSLASRPSTVYNPHMGNKVDIESRPVPGGVEYKAEDNYDQTFWVLIDPGSSSNPVFDELCAFMESDDVFCDMLSSARENNTYTQLNDNPVDLEALFSFLEAFQRSCALEESMESPVLPKPRSRI